MYPMALLRVPFPPPLYVLFFLSLLLPFTSPLQGGTADQEHRPNSRHRHLAETWSYILSSPAHTSSNVDDPSPLVPPPRTLPTPPTSSAAASERCPGCVDRRAALEKSAGEAHLAALRIEFIKQQILKKLRLKEAPTGVSPRTALPKPLSMGTILQKTQQNRENDDFYAKTDQVILFPDNENFRCVPASQDPSACFTFRLPAELQAEDVTTAQLWVYKERDRSDSHNQTLVVSEVAFWDRNRSFQKTKRLTIESTSVKEGWVKINLLWVVRHWLEHSELSHAIHVACPTCGLEVSKSPVSLLPENKPFLVINTNSNSMSRRPPRNVNCIPGLTECCRESLYVSFADIGWNDWIIQPLGYQAYFCRGSCTNAASLTQSGSHYSSIMQRVLHQPGSTNKPELVPCCTATRLSPIQLIYMDNKQTITQKTLPNMAVDACGCM